MAHAHRPPLPRHWDYPSHLPVSQAREDFLSALQAHQVTIVCGATGSGKSTQLPKFCLEAGYGSRGLIGHTQPRRIAARALAERVTEELGEAAAGQTVGWQVRFKSVQSEATRVKLMTDGLLLNELRRDRLLQRYDCIIVDEAHERSLNIDFLLGCLKRLLPQRPELKLIITSATLDAEKFARHFDDAPVLEVPGKSHPIDLRYRDPENGDINDAAAEAIRDIWRERDGDILIFLPGEREIREMAAALADHPRLRKLPQAEILPLYARLGSARQQKIFHPGGGRRIVLATNVAETSLTVPGIRHVIDTGTARVSRYNPRTKVQNLQIEDIARANADQRMGRCGRTAPGICIRLYAEEDYAGRPRFADPEIQRTNLASVLLQMADLKLGEPEDFPFVDAPHQRYLSDARRLLEQLQALRRDGRGLTRTGRQLARLPLDPRFGRILVAGHRLGCLGDVIPIVAALSMQDPRERDFDNRQKIDQAQAVFRDKRSDFLSLLALWRQAREARRQGSNRDFRNWCQQHHVNARRMQEWRDLVRQIRSEWHGLHAPGESAEAIPQDSPEDKLQPELIHRSLLCGLLDHIGQHDVDDVYRGPRNARWQIHPESALRKRRPNWIVAAEIVSTRKVYARCVAQVDPQWVEKAAAHLVRKQALEPQWDKARGEVVAREQVSLFGLILSADRQVAYAKYDAEHARQIFIEQALVAGRWGKPRPPDFLRRNQRLLKQLQDEESRQRSRGIVRPDEQIIDWYAQRLPVNICSRQQLLQALPDIDQEALTMCEADLRDREAENLAAAFPGELQIGELQLPLTYVFEPGSDTDGINIDIPVASLNQLSTQRLDWLVPGALAGKIEHLLKAQPKSIRRRFVPISDAVADCCADLVFAEGDLHAQLARWMQRRMGQPGPSAAALRATDLPPNLRMRIRLRDADGGILAAGRDLEALRERHGGQARRQFRELHDARWERQGLRDWSCPDLPERVELEDGLQAFPCLLDRGEQVDLVLRDDPQEAAELHARGLLRLLWLSQASTLKQRLKSLPDRQKLLLRLSTLPAPEPSLQLLLDTLPGQPELSRQLPDALAARALAEIQLDPSIRSQAAFEAAQQQPGVARRLQELWSWTAQLAEAWGRWQALERPPENHPAREDIDCQLAWLLAPGWVARTPALRDLPRFVDGLVLRAEKLHQDPATDEQRMALLQPHWQRCTEALQDALRHKRTPSAALVDYRWLIEEYRISVFAQTIKTRQKVSEKRLDRAWQRVREAQG